MAYNGLIALCQGNWIIKDKIYTINNIINKRIRYKNLKIDFIDTMDIVKYVNLIKKKKKLNTLLILNNILSNLYNDKDSIELRGEKIYAKN